MNKVTSSTISPVRKVNLSGSWNKWILPYAVGYESLGGKNRTDQKSRQEGKVESLRGLSVASAGESDWESSTMVKESCLRWDDRVKSSHDPFGVC